MSNISLDLSNQGQKEIDVELEVKVSEDVTILFDLDTFFIEQIRQVERRYVYEVYEEQSSIEDLKELREDIKDAGVEDLDQDETDYLFETSLLVSDKIRKYFLRNDRVFVNAISQGRAEYAKLNDTQKVSIISHVIDTAQYAGLDI